MTWKIFIITFGAIFIAELADKTQLVGIGLSAKTGKPVVVWIGSVAAYAVITAISVFAGAFLSKYMAPSVIKYTAATLFIIIGILIFFGKI